jgi:hypothetical protein
MNVFSFFSLHRQGHTVCRDKRGVLFVLTRMNVKSIKSGCIPLQVHTRLI